jgi:methyl-accepting chemotaxis protein
MPTAFITTPIYEGKTRLGVMVLELSNSRLNQIMTYDSKWSKMGLGKTGETQLLGEDKLVRTNPRLFLEDKEAYFKALENTNVDKERIKRIRSLDTPILVQKIDTDAVRQALDGEKGEKYWYGYTGAEVLGAYQPIDFSDFRWALIAKINKEEAFAPIKKLTRHLLLTGAILIPLFTLLSLYLAQLLTKPINRLITSIKKITSGEKDVEVDITSQDEIGKLASTFNIMARNLKEKERLIEEKDRANRDLLLNILPEPIAERLERGEEDIADNFPNVTIIYAEIEGLNLFTDDDGFSDDGGADRAVALLNELVGSFDSNFQLSGT